MKIGKRRAACLTSLFLWANLLPSLVLFSCQQKTVVASRQDPPGTPGTQPEDGLTPPDSSADNPVQVPPLAPPSCVRYVDVDSSVAVKDGLGWATAFGTVQEGIDAAAATMQPCEVWVAEGVYVVPGSSQDDTLWLRPGVSVYGGFSGTERFRMERDFTNRITILDGSYRVNHVVTGSDDSALDGFHVAHGKADGIDTRGYGGGMINLDCSPRVENCVFRDNQASKNGAGMWNRNGSPHILGCAFRNNAANDYGGGMANQSASPSITTSVFEANTADQMGGGIYFQGGNPMVTNSVFAKNRATHGGGGLAGKSSAVLTVVNCTLTGNQAGLLPLSPEPGAIILDSTCNASIINSILWGDKQPEVDVLHGTYNVTYCVFMGGYIGQGNLVSDPLIDEASGYRLRAGSPCVDAGDATQAPATDKDGRPRVDAPGTANTGAGNPPFIDIGAYEFSP